MVAHTVVSFLLKIPATALPTCDVYFQQQGSDFVVDKGNIRLKSNQKQSVRADERSEVNHFFMAVVCLVVNEQSSTALRTMWGPGKCSGHTSSQYPQGWNGRKEDTKST